MSDVGKAAKHMGQVHPRDLRRLDPVPERPTPRPAAKRKEERNFGYSFIYHGLLARWRKLPEKVEYKWFAKASQRDQALKDLIHKNTHGFYKDIKAVDSQSDAGAKQ